PIGRLDRAWVGAVCDRRRGVGADGILWLSIERDTGRTRMVVFNADGSRPEMCGNGARCVAAYVVHEAGAVRGQQVQLVTDAGVRDMPCVSTDERGGAIVRVAMGPTHVGEPVSVEGGVRAVPVSVGNPHAVVFDPVADAQIDAVLHALRARRDVWPDG